MPNPTRAELEDIRAVEVAAHEIDTWVQAYSDNSAHPYRSLVKVSNEVVYLNETYLQIFVPGRPFFWVPSRFVHHASEAQHMGDTGILYVRKVWAIYHSWK